MMRRERKGARGGTQRDEERSGWAARWVFGFWENGLVTLLKMGRSRTTRSYVENEKKKS